MEASTFQPRRFARVFWIGATLFFITMFLYWPVTHFKFLLFDDETYVTDNPHVAAGFSWAAVKWAFASTYASNWHPLTWISHMLDCSVFGLYAGGHHLTNAVLHSLNSLLLFLLLRRMTRRLWPSALVAALFAWHPLHVESVAWVAERKDVLSALFMMLTLGAYLRFTEATGGRAAKGFYALALLAFAGGLMAKSMLVTLPGVLLLLDYWPLRRFGLSTVNDQPSTLLRLFREKIPFFALSCVAGVMTIGAQSSSHAMRSLKAVSISERVSNALLAYASYLRDTLWPANLCVLYPMPAAAQVGGGIGATLLLLGISFLVVRRWRSSPWLMVGWFWFLGMLLPVIGLVQVGNQARADRYTYLPLIGLFIAVVWESARFLERRPALRRAAAGVAIFILIAFITLAQMQLTYWRDSVTLFSRAVSVTQNNAVAHNNLGVALNNAGRPAEALDQHALALQIVPDYPSAHNNIGNDLVNLGRLDAAARHFTEALKLAPDDEVLLNNFGVVLAQQGKMAAALEHFRRAIVIQPDYPRSYYNLALAFEQLGRPDAALTNFSLALQKAQARNAKELIAEIKAKLQSYPPGHYSAPGAPRQ